MPACMTLHYENQGGITHNLNGLAEQNNPNSTISFKIKSNILYRAEQTLWGYGLKTVQELRNKWSSLTTQ